jgi:hypothetical protein
LERVAIFGKLIITGLVPLFLALCATADDFDIPPETEFGEISMDSLSLRNATSGNTGSFDLPEEIEALENYSLSNKEIGLVFDTATAEKVGRHGFVERPARTDGIPQAVDIGAENNWPELAVRYAEPDPLKALSFDPNKEKEPGISIGLNPYEEEVILNWFVGF